MLLNGTTSTLFYSDLSAVRHSYQLLLFVFNFLQLIDQLEFGKRILGKSIVF